jgi:prophage antirepressor-like protein
MVKMDKIQVLDFNGDRVRAVVEGSGDPWFVAYDLCRILELEHDSALFDRLAGCEKGVSFIAGSNGEGMPMIIVSKSGMFFMISNSRIDTAKAFKKWITSEVLPSIRRAERDGDEGETDLEIARERSFYYEKYIILLKKREAAQEEKTRIQCDIITLMPR